MSIGRWIKQARKNRGLSQDQLLKAVPDSVALDQSRLSKIERGLAIPTVPQIIAISDATGATIDELLRGATPSAAADLPGLTTDELYILKTIRAVDLNFEEAIRRLWVAPPTTSYNPIGETLKTDPAGGEQENLSGAG